VPPPPPALRAALARGLPKDALLENPFDLGEAAKPARYRHTLRTILAAEAYDSVLTLFIPRAGRFRPRAGNTPDRGADGAPAGMRPDAGGLRD